MILLTPGPTPVPQRVRDAMAGPIIHHRTPEYEALQAECDSGLQAVFRTRSPVLTLVGSGSAAFEAAQLSLAQPGDAVVACVNGKFGARWQSVFDRAAPRAGLQCASVEAPWGEPVDPDRLAVALRRTPNVSIVTAVHCETSTTTLNDVRALAEVTRAEAPEALFIVDGVSAVGAVPAEMDAWGFDVMVSASQKALMLPPGLGFAAVGERARQRLAAIGDDSMLAPMYLDLRAYLGGHAEQSPPFTPAVSLMVGLRESFAMIIERGGVEAVWRDVARRAGATRAALQAMGLRLVTNATSDAVTGVFAPDDAGNAIRDICRREHGVHLAGGQNEWAGRVLRISHMGAVTDEDALAGVRAIAAALQVLGPSGSVDPIAGVREMEARLFDATV